MQQQQKTKHRDISDAYANEEEEVCRDCTLTEANKNTLHIIYWRMKTRMCAK